MTITDANFNEVINGGKPVVIDFWASWCGPCRIMEPMFEELAKTHGDRITFGKLNIDENQKTVEYYQIMSMPTFMLFQHGEPIDNVVGANLLGLQRLVNKVAITAKT